MALSAVQDLSPTCPHGPIMYSEEMHTKNLLGQANIKEFIKQSKLLKEMLRK